MTFDQIRTVATIVGLLVCFAGVVSTWTMLQFRMDELEKDNKELKEELKILTVEFSKKGEEVRCLICEAHKMRCPGC